jgi:hypothetical protein
MRAPSDEQIPTINRDTPAAYRRKSAVRARGTGRPFANSLLRIEGREVAGAGHSTGILQQVEKSRRMFRKTVDGWAKDIKAAIR